MESKRPKDGAELTAALQSLFDELMDLPCASAGLVEDVCNAISTPKRMRNTHHLASESYQEAIVGTLRHVLAKFEGKKWPDGSVDHAAWEVLMFRFGRWLLQNDERLVGVVREVTGYDAAKLVQLRDRALEAIECNAQDWIAAKDSIAAKRQTIPRGDPETTQ